MTIRAVFIPLMILLLGNSYDAPAADRFVASFPKQVYEAWLSRVDATISADDELRGTTLLGSSIIRTYDTNEGVRKLEIHLTHDGMVYDVGEYLDLGPIADTYISRAAQIIAARIIWSALVKDEAYLRSVVASNYVQVETSYLGSKESQLLQYVRLNPGLNPSSFYLTIDENGPVLASDAGNMRLRVRITPTLDLLLQGQSVLYRDFLVSMLTSEAGNGIPNDYEPNAFYGLTSKVNAYSYRLPEIEYYTNERSFTRRSNTAHWVPTNREQLAIPEGRIASLVAHRWATLSLPFELRYRDLLTDASFEMELAIEGKEVEKHTLVGENGLDRMGTVIGNGLPAYYNTISARKGDGDEVVVRGIWMVRHPELAFEHIFRITDTFEITPQGRYAWKKSDIRAVLAVRMDHIQQLKAPAPAATGQPPIFRVQVNR
jgi:hypothetical protein